MLQIQKKAYTGTQKNSEIKLELAEGKQKKSISLDDIGVTARSSNNT